MLVRQLDMYFNLRKITLISYIALTAWIVWHIAFMQGYHDAVNDLGKRGYRFEQTRFMNE